MKISERYQAVIKDIDSNLSQARFARLSITDKADRAKLLNKINELLDERLIFMRRRDAAQLINI